MKNLVLLFSIIVTLSSCNFYKPAMINAPILEERGEAEVGVSIGNGTNITASYAIGRHLAVSGRFTSFSNINYEITSTDTTVFEFNAPNYNYELAVGYFNATESFNYSIYAGYLMGKTASLNEGFLTSNEDLAIGADISSFFVQGSAFANLDGESYIGLVARFNALNFTDFTTSEIFSNNTTAFSPANNNQIVGQVGLQYNLKKDKFGLMGQFQYAFTDSPDSYFTLRKVGIHVGAYLRIGEFLRK